MDKQIKLPISAIVVAFNEGHLIERCLKSVLFCDEILFFDLGSSDNTLSIAEQIEGVKTHSHSHVPYAEHIQYEYKNKTKHNWILVLDPDEEISDGLQNELRILFDKEIPNNIGSITVPWIFYLKNTQLHGTPWGGINKKGILFHRERVEVTQYVHRGRPLKSPFVDYNIEYNENCLVYHFWMQSYSSLLKKHLKYLKFEPESRYDNGVRTCRKEILKTPYREFKFAFFEKKGYKDKFLGLSLSIFWAWYQTSSLIKLYSWQKKKYKL